MKKSVLSMVLTLLMATTLGLAFNLVQVQPAKAPFIARALSENWQIYAIREEIYCKKAPS